MGWRLGGWLAVQAQWHAAGFPGLELELCATPTREDWPHGTAPSPHSHPTLRPCIRRSRRWMPRAGGTSRWWRRTPASLCRPRAAPPWSPSPTPSPVRPSFSSPLFLIFLFFPPPFLPARQRGPQPRVTCAARGAGECHTPPAQSLLLVGEIWKALCLRQEGCLHPPQRHKPPQYTPPPYCTAPA